MAKTKAEREQVRRIRETERQLGEDYRAVLATPAGKRVFEFILGPARTGVVPPTTILPDTEAVMGSAAGRQKVGHWILFDIETYAPDAYLEIMTARVRKLKEEEARKSATEKENNDEDDA